MQGEPAGTPIDRRSDNGNVNASYFPNVWGYDNTGSNSAYAGPFQANFNYSASNTNTNIAGRTSSHHTPGTPPSETGTAGSEGLASRRKTTAVSNRRRNRTAVPPSGGEGSIPSFQ